MHQEAPPPVEEDAGCAAVGREKLFDCLRENGMLVARRKYVITTDSSQWRRQYGNLVEGRVPENPKEVMASYITHLLDLFEANLLNIN